VTTYSLKRELIAIINNGKTCSANLVS
jgi:hypothetical protein